MSEAADGGSIVRLDALLGEWRWKASAGGTVMAGGTTTFEPIEDGAFVAHRTVGDPPGEGVADSWGEHSPLPTVAVIAVDDFSGELTYAYADARGVRRVYAMTLDADGWTLSGRPGETFFQRFAGRFEPGGSVSGRWERSADGVEWELDFELAYSRP